MMMMTTININLVMKHDDNGHYDDDDGDGNACGTSKGTPMDCPIGTPIRLL